MADHMIEAAGRTLRTSNLEKVFFPDVGISKGEVVEYYRRVSEVMLPHLADRPLTLRRFPDGIAHPGFYQKQASDYFPGWLRRVRIKTSDGPQDQVAVDDAAGVVYLADQATVEFHPWPVRSGDVRKPDRIVFDLDPPPGSGLAELREAVRTLGDLLDDLGLAWFLMTSGSKGFHLVGPLMPEVDIDRIRAWAKSLAEVAAARRPDLLTTASRKNARRGRIFVDYLRNAYGQTSVAPYSIRARPGAPVATPIDRDELGRVEPWSYTIANLFKRLGQKNDPWSGIDRHRQRLPEIGPPD